MSHIKFFKDITKISVAEAGGKGASLGEMTRAKIPVPPGFVVLANAFDRFLHETGLAEDMPAQLKKVNPEDTNSVDKASAVIRDMIHDRLMPKDLGKEILGAFDKLDAKYVAVRSSATAEDSSVASWAGELETYLNTERKNVLDKVKQCWSSLFTPRAIFYRHEKKLLDHYVSVAVVIQKMVQAEVSGIAFTVHPVTEDYDQMIIEAGFGLGEAIVGGLITPDSYVISKKAMSLLDVSVSTQTRKLIRATKRQNKKIKTPPRTHPLIGEGQREGYEELGSNVWVELRESEGGKQKLSGKQIMELAGVCVGIEKHYGFPCDIEWAMTEGKFYITQSRPITTLKPLV